MRLNRLPDLVVLSVLGCVLLYVVLSGAFHLSAEWAAMQSDLRLLKGEVYELKHGLKAYGLH